MGGGWEGGIGAFTVQAKVLEGQVGISKFQGVERERQGWLKGCFDLFSYKNPHVTTCLSVFCYSFACLLKFIMPFQRKGMRKSVLGILISSKSEADFKTVQQKLHKIKEKLLISQLRAMFSENQKTDCKPLTPKKATRN